MSAPEHPDERVVAALDRRAERGDPRGAAAVLAAARSEGSTSPGPAPATGRTSGRRWATAAAVVLVVVAVAGGVWVSVDDDGDDGALTSTDPEVCDLLAAPVTEPAADAPDVVVYLYPSTPPERRAELAEVLLQTRAERVREVDAAEAYADFRDLFADEPAMLASVRAEDLPTSIEFWLADPADREDVAASLRASGIQDVYEVVARGDGPSVLDALVWPGHDPSAGFGARSIATAVYGPGWPAAADAVARAAEAEGDDELAEAIEVVVAEVAARVASARPPTGDVSLPVADAAALVEVHARDRCDLEPAGPFRRSGRAETTGTIPASGPGD